MQDETTTYMEERKSTYQLNNKYAKGNTRTKSISPVDKRKLPDPDMSNRHDLTSSNNDDIKDKDKTSTNDMLQAWKLFE